MKGTPWSRIQGQNSVDNELLEIVGSGKRTGSVLKVANCSFRHDFNKRAKSTEPKPSPSSSSTWQNGGNASRTKSPRGRSPSGRMFRLPCKSYLKGTCTFSSCEKWHPPLCLFYKSEIGFRFGEKCSHAHRQVEEQPSKRSKKNCDKSAVAMLKRNEQHQRTERVVVYDHSSNTRQLGLRISGYGAAEVFIDFTEELRHTETDPMCTSHKCRCTSR